MLRGLHQGGEALVVHEDLIPRAVGTGGLLSVTAPLQTLMEPDKAWPRLARGAALGPIAAPPLLRIDPVYTLLDGCRHP
jgi:hypothetical protein